MKKFKLKRSTLLMNVLAIVVMSAILVGATFAWFTDTAISSGNKIQAGTLEVDLQLLDKEEGWVSLKDSNAPIFDCDTWEPGYTDVKLLKVENKGSLALQWKARFVSSDELSALAEVIDVYVLPSQDEPTYPETRDLESLGYTCVGTVADFVNTIETTTTGTLLAGEWAYLSIALRMRTTAGNEYQGLSIGGTFDIMILATQLSAEADGFNNGYDSEATLDWVPVSNAEQFRLALANGVKDIVLMGDIVVDNTFEISADANIDGNGYTISRTPIAATLARTAAAEPYLGSVILVKEGTTLTLTNVTLDGGAVWTGDVDETLGRGTVNEGLVAQGTLITTESNAHVVLGKDAVVQNTDGTFAITIGGNKNATLVIDGGEIRNNNSSYGAIYAGGSITINSGKINGNSAMVNGKDNYGGVFRMVSACALTMNGGEICNNKSLGTGGVIWGYGASTYNFNGGKVANNEAAAGGVMWPGEGSTINVSGDVEITGNKAANGGAFRFTSNCKFYMTGGKIYDNVSTSNPTWDGFYGYSTVTNITGGELKDFSTIHGGHTPTIGDADIQSVIYFAISTNHNTCNLKADFSSFKFIVADGANFSAFNFKPEASYTYTEGDENKLICLNSGYTTYYDAASGTFRLMEVTEAAE